MSRRAPKTNTEVRQEQIARAALAVVARDGLYHLNISAPAGPPIPAQPEAATAKWQ